MKQIAYGVAMFKFKSPHEIVELFSYVIVFGPEFPQSDNMQLDRALDSLRSGVISTQQGFADLDAISNCSKCLEEISRAALFYDDGNAIEAVKSMQIARELFRRAVFKGNANKQNTSIE